MTLPPFHLAFPVDDLAAARAFYVGVLGCGEGRSSEAWIDFEFFGHQIVTHLVPRRSDDAVHTPVDGHGVPVPHFGVVLAMPQWRECARRLTSAGVDFVIAPTMRFVGQPGEQATMFFRDPAGNAIEIKGFADLSQVFAT